jgi:hypothetical protein
MTTVCAVLCLAGLFPLGSALRANRETSLLHAVCWGVVAWLAWGMAILADDVALPPAAARHVALGLTGAAGIAVLGARRPHVLAWDFVMLGLVAVIMLPLVESLLLGTDTAGPVRVLFLIATLSVGLLNYLPTCSSPAVLLLAVALGGELATAFAPDAMPAQLFDLILLLTPWGARACLRGGRRDRGDFDCHWLDFRDRFGLFWAQRVREQFNAAAANQGWAVKLSWRGLHRTSRDEAVGDSAKMLETLRAITQRFMPTNGEPGA